MKQAESVTIMLYSLYQKSTISICPLIRISTYDFKTADFNMTLFFISDSK